MFQSSWDCCRPKIHAVTEWTMTAHTSAITLTTRRAAADTFPASWRSVAHRYTTDRIRYTASTMMSHMRGLPRLEYANSSHRRRGWPRSTTTKPMASTVQQTDVHTATLEMPPKPLMPKARGTLEMMRPPAESPTKNMKQVM